MGAPPQVKFELDRLLTKDKLAPALAAHLNPCEILLALWLCSCSCSANQFEPSHSKLFCSHMRMSAGLGLHRFVCISRVV